MDESLPGIGEDLPEEDTQRGAFARAVVAEQAENLAPVHFQREIVHRRLAPESLPQMAQFNHRKS